MGGLHVGFALIFSVLPRRVWIINQRLNGRRDVMPQHYAQIVFNVGDVHGWGWRMVNANINGRDGGRFANVFLNCWDACHGNEFETNSAFSCCLVIAYLLYQS